MAKRQRHPQAAVRAAGNHKPQLTVYCRFDKALELEAVQRDIGFRFQVTFAFKCVDFNSPHDRLQLPASVNAQQQQRQQSAQTRCTRRGSFVPGQAPLSIFLTFFVWGQINSALSSGHTHRKAHTLAHTYTQASAHTHQHVAPVGKVRDFQQFAGKLCWQFHFMVCNLFIRYTHIHQYMYAYMYIVVYIHTCHGRVG